MLTLSPDIDGTFSYEEALRSSQLPCFQDFGTGGTSWALWQFGLTFYKTGLALIDNDAFKIALKALTKGC
jgi:hypothetical protein